jgi:Txe/YoeB family toxin of Txe-Axe toxin-antitoxin module
MREKEGWKFVSKEDIKRTPFEGIGKPEALKFQ